MGVWVIGLVLGSRVQSLWAVRCEPQGLQSLSVVSGFNKWLVGVPGASDLRTASVSCYSRSKALFLIHRSQEFGSLSSHMDRVPTMVPRGGRCCR